MSRRATGTVRVDASGRWSVRLTLDGRRPRYRLGEDESIARAVGARMADVARRLSKAKFPDVGRILKAVADPTTRDEALALADRVCAGRMRSRSKASTTFRELGEAWTSGALHRDFPDHVRKKKTAHRDAQLLEARIYPLVGHVRLAEFTLEHAEQVMRALPPELAPATRRQHAQVISRIMRFAAYPARAIDRSPIPRGFVPPQNSKKAKCYLYPPEDARLLRSLDVPLAARLLWGFLAREGMRYGEAVALAWADIDFELGILRLDKNKTNDPRHWKLSDGVVRALRAWRTLQEGHLVFDVSGWDAGHAADAFRAHLQLAGVDRKELFDATDARLRVRVHDLRGTFVTLALANGRTEAWVTDRTGHKSSVMVHGYKRTARNAAEVEQKPLAPLDEAIPEIASIVHQSSKGGRQDGGPDAQSPSKHDSEPGWRNGIRRRLKIARTKVHEGSTPSPGTGSLLRGPLLAQLRHSFSQRREDATVKESSGYGVKSKEAMVSEMSASQVFVALPVALPSKSNVAAKA